MSKLLIRVPGNLLIRPAPLLSKSPYNFEIVLLDHGQYFDIDDELRVNYSKFWLSLMAPASPSVNADRRKVNFMPRCSSSSANYSPSMLS